MLRENVRGVGAQEREVWLPVFSYRALFVAEKDTFRFFSHRVNARNAKAPGDETQITSACSVPEMVGNIFLHEKFIEKQFRIFKRRKLSVERETGNKNEAHALTNE